MSRLTLFAKGNSDVFETLFACPDRSTPWNGINDALRAMDAAARIRVRHETMTRSDALLATEGDVPSVLHGLVFDPPYDIASQFSATVFDGRSHAIVLSIQPDVTVTLARHRATGALFMPAASPQAGTLQRDWIRRECDFAPLLTPEESLLNLERLVARLRLNAPVPILVYNMSSVVPGEAIDTYDGISEVLSVRIKRYNLMLIELSRRTGVIVVDVDRIAARHGADRLKLDGVRLNALGCRLVGEDVVILRGDQGSPVTRGG